MGWPQDYDDKFNDMMTLKESDDMTNEQQLDQRIEMLIDRSGSMSSMRDEMLSGINYYLKKLKDEKMAGSITIRTFDTESLDTVYENVNIEKALLLTDSDFMPRSGTPLYDSIGTILGKIPLDEKVGTVFVIVTDGQDNASSEETKESISKRISALEKEQNWLIMYMGANQDAWAVGSGLGLSSGKSLNFTVGNVRQAFAASVSNTMAYATTNSSIDTVYTPEDEAAATGTAKSDKGKTQEENTAGVV